jgi:hypothetical protein
MSEKLILGVASLGVVVIWLGSASHVGPPASASQPIQLVAGASPEASSKPSVAPTPKAAVVTTVEETQVVAIPFEKQTIDDPNYPAGTVQVTTIGVAGSKTIVFLVTKRDGVVSSRTKESETVTLAPVTEVTSNGTYVAPPPVAAAPASCDPNYSGPCVPIASDVDCAGGSGNGPAYVSGPVYVVGSDIYDLDRDGDGVGCD